MKVIFTRIARRELEDASAYYELQLTGLGRRFRREVKAAAERIARHPETWPVERGPIRKFLMHRFPYKLLYAIEPDHVLVVAVAHLHRRPDYWVNRQES